MTSDVLKNADTLYTAFCKTSEDNLQDISETSDIIQIYAVSEDIECTIKMDEPVSE